MVRKEAPSGEEAWADGVGCNAKEHGQIPLLPLCDVHNIVLGPGRSNGIAVVVYTYMNSIMSHRIEYFSRTCANKAMRIHFII